MIFSKQMLMRFRPKLFVLMLLLFALSSKSYAIVELSFDFAYQKQVYGAARQNNLVNRTYMGSWAYYFSNYTALELNYSNSQEITTEKNTVALTSTLSITGTQNRVTNTVYGVGIRQSFAPKGARIRPTMSLGYATQEMQSISDYTFSDSVSGASTTVTTSVIKTRADSAFGTFALQLGITQTFAIRASVATVFPAFEWNAAKNNLKYLAGFNWIF